METDNLNENRDSQIITLTAAEQLLFTPEMREFIKVIGMTVKPTPEELATCVTTMYKALDAQPISTGASFIAMYFILMDTYIRTPDLQNAFAKSRDIIEQYGKI